MLEPECLKGVELGGNEGFLTFLRGSERYKEGVLNLMRGILQGLKGFFEEMKYNEKEKGHKKGGKWHFF